ncbi:salicylate hydroxylase [Histoplasma capsulatum G186AR]|uniref:Salicylate hydroxylase n=2 Tax=Ajellomyces capsulatus TaxID=5037 RepID=C0NNZ2_AJECG|nr:salicylate hydroxylase [Histoplasma capsulatum G186AR]EEH06652.1 salicylate hydroxylase [Histoplasma capsulatum G186AR]KAG5304811.1 salicylate hydroxylase [Histoplasma capsulatum]QSS75770.1 salicylate hydroxylase [Histoplasma capsulatum G186AR]
MASNTQATAPYTILILGGGIAGIASALALSKTLTPVLPNLKIIIYELRDVPSTSGGAINLTPVAHRHLDHLGVLDELQYLGPQGGVEVDEIEIFSSHSGKKMGAVDFAGKDGKGYGGYKGRRIMRICLHLALISAVEKRSNIEMMFGKKVVGGIETDKCVTIYFEDGTFAKGDLALGCDGVHSATRSTIVDPDRISEYTGISFIQATIKSEVIRSSKHFSVTALNRSRHGTMLTTYCDSEKENMFVAALAEVDEARLTYEICKYQASDSWKTKSTAVMILRDDIQNRFGKSAIPCIREIAEKCWDWFLYPVYQIHPGGKWYTERILLLGDAAHAMPPKDESAAYALDDAILFARVLTKYIHEPLSEAFRIYESIRRKTIDHAYKTACENWTHNKDSGRLSNLLAEWITPLSLMRQKKKITSAWVFDAMNVDISPPNPASRQSTASTVR